MGPYIDGLYWINATMGCPTECPSLQAYELSRRYPKSREVPAKLPRDLSSSTNRIRALVSDYSPIRRRASRGLPRCSTLSLMTPGVSTPTYTKPQSKQRMKGSNMRKKRTCMKCRPKKSPGEGSRYDHTQYPPLTTLHTTLAHSHAKSHDNIQALTNRQSSTHQ